MPIAILGATMVLCASDVASAPAQRAAGLRGLSAATGAALSIGAPNQGRLDGGIRLIEAPYLRIVPYYAESNARWGLPALVGLIDRAARRVARRFPGAVLSVGDLSRRGGGELDRHHSHESGRDADLGFYLRSVAKKPVLADRFVALSADGTAPVAPGTFFDEARNWALVEALVEDPFTRVSHIFVAPHLRARLLRHAEQTGVPLAARQRASETMMQPHGAPEHDDHFHIRIACPREQQGTCIEQVQIYSVHTHPPLARPRSRRGTDRLVPRLAPQSPEDPDGIDFVQTLTPGPSSTEPPICALGQSPALGKCASPR